MAEPQNATVLAEEIDAFLGRAAPTLAELDRDAAYPLEQLARLDGLGLPAYYVPREHGGRLESHHELFELWRAMSRHDLSVAVAHAKTYLGSVCVWIAGSPEQARGLAGAVLGGSRVGWALTEPGHGADLLAGELTAVPEEGGYRLDGTKWPINNATRGDLLTVLARTDERGGGRGFGLLLVDKAELAPGSTTQLRKVDTLGIRGVDISGIRFDGAWVDESALVGTPGGGAEAVLKGLQLTRTLCSAISVGATEHALRLATRFAVDHRIQGRPLVERPFVRSLLGRSAATLLTAEAAGLAGCRAAHTLTGEMSVVSAVLKALAPTLADEVLGRLGDFLGARSLLTELHEHGAFQKLARDHAVLAIFDGSTPVNRHALINQFASIAAGHAVGSADGHGVAAATTLTAPLAPMPWRRLRAASRRGCSVVASARTTLPAVEAAGDAGLSALARYAVEAMDRVCAAMGDVRPSRQPSMYAHDLAQQYELCFAAASALHLWTANRAAAEGAEPWAGEPWAGRLWLSGVLREIARRLDPALCGDAPEFAPAWHEELDHRLVDWLVRAAEHPGPITAFGFVQHLERSHG
ncbi:acyl-CoA dehydrogenase family protein [Streptomyces sp. NPDC004059]